MTCFVGIDIAKHKHACFIMNHQGEVVRDSFSITNDRSRFTGFLEVLSKLEPAQTIRIGLEATGHYGMNLKVFLEDHDVPFMEFNPMLVRWFSQANTPSMNQNRSSRCHADCRAFVFRRIQTLQVFIIVCDLSLSLRSRRNALKDGAHESRILNQNEW